MRCVGVIRAICVTAVISACGQTPTFADPLLDDTPTSGNSAAGIRSEKFLYFSGFDLWRNGGSFYGGMQIAPDGLNNDGFTLKVLLAEGTYRYRSGASDIRGTGLLAAFLPGWRIKRGDLELKIFVGLDLQNHSLSPDDVSNGLRGNHAGMRVGADIWWQPSDSMMLAASISGSTIGTSFGIRGAAGWRVMDRFWAGPEIETSGDEVYRQYRVGAHITSLKTGNFEWALGAGYVEDNSARAGAYGRVSLLTRR
jgi:hypothetical protein